jgi:hypothetical protein
MWGLQTQTILQKLFLPTLAAPPATSAASGAKAAPASMAAAGGAAAGGAAADESLPAEHAEVRWRRGDCVAVPRGLHSLRPNMRPWRF